MNKHVIPAALMAVLILGSGIATVSASADLADYSTEKEALEEKAMEMVPATYQEALKLVEESGDEGAAASVTGRTRRFLLWTHEGEHVMWGRLGNGYFVGEDNQGRESWGIYQGGTFAGFYGDEFFVGKYRRGFWKAENMFGEERAFGRYVVFPQPYPVHRPLARAVAPVAVEAVSIDAVA